MSRLVQTTLLFEDRPTPVVETSETGETKITLGAPTSELHYKTWFIEHYGRDPTGIVDPHSEKRIYGRMIPRWREIDVYKYINLDELKTQLQKVEARQHRREDLKTWFGKQKEATPRIGEILQRLYDVGKEIGRLHNLKAECRGSEEDGEYHVCQNCDAWTDEQTVLRKERRALFEELCKITGKSKAYIQRARKYIRDDANRAHKESIKPCT